jgi:hypothetical protein
MKLRYSPRALGDLAVISNYLVKRSPAGARAVEQAIAPRQPCWSNFLLAAGLCNNDQT